MRCSVLTVMVVSFQGQEDSFLSVGHALFCSLLLAVVVLFTKIHQSGVILLSRCGSWWGVVPLFIVDQVLMLINFIRVSLRYDY